MTDENIPLSEDTIASDIAGLPKPLKKPGDLVIENPAVPVNVGGYKIVDGVAEGGPDDSNPKTIETSPPTENTD